MKKIITLSLIMVIALVMTGCGKMVHVEGKLEDLMTKVYEGISEDQLPMMLQNMELDEENKTSFIGEANIKYKEALASESGIGSIAHSVVLIRMEEGTSQDEINKAMQELKDKVNPRKWLCVGAEEVQVSSNGDLIIVVLSDDHGDTLINNFNNLK